MSRLGIVVCGAPLAARATDVVAAAEGMGWDVALTLTDAARQWSSLDDMPAVGRDSDALLVCPLTFNTANKWALGIADSVWLSVLNESLAAGTPIVAVPMVNETLWRHPAWESTLSRLTAAGAKLLDPSTGVPDPRPVRHGSGDQVAQAFDPLWIFRLLP